MELKHLQASIWAMGFVVAVGALAQDSDGDKVADDAPDHCPDTPGVKSNYGCPANLEVVVVHGWYSDAFDWVTDYAICPDGTLRTSYDECPDYGYWGEFAAAYYAVGSHVNTLQEDDGYRPQEDEDCQGTECWSPGEWLSWCWQTAASDHSWLVDTTPECKHYGFPTADALYDELLAVAAKHPKTTCIVAVAGTAIVGVWTKGRAGKWIATGATAAGVSCSLLFE